MPYSCIIIQLKRCVVKSIELSPNGIKKLYRNTFELYKSDLELRGKLVLNRRKQADKQYVIEVVSRKQDSGLIDDTIKVFGKSISQKKYYTIGLVLLTFILLLGLEFIKFLEKYKN